MSAAKKKARRKAKNKPGAGRPTKLSRAFINGFVEIIAEGNYLCTAAGLMGVSEECVRLWMRQGETDLSAKKSTLAVEFFGAVTRAERQAERESVNQIREAGAGVMKTTVTEETVTLPDGSTKKTIKTTQTLERDPKMAVEYLQRKHPERWGRKDKVEATVEQKGEQAHTLRLVQEGREALGERFKHRMVGLN